MKKLILILSFLTLPLATQAQDAFYITGLLGLTNVDISPQVTSYDTELSYGLRAGLLFNDHVSAGLFLKNYSTSKNNFNITNDNVDFSLLNIMAEVTYFFNEADENTFWISGLLGTTQLSASYTGPSNLSDDDDSGTALGASVGYHFMVAPNWSLSPQMTIIRTDVSPSTITDLSGMVNITLWL